MTVVLPPVPALSQGHVASRRITFMALLLNIACVTTAELLLRTGAAPLTPRLIRSSGSPRCDHLPP